MVAATTRFFMALGKRMGFTTLTLVPPLQRPIGILARDTLKRLLQGNS